MFLLKTFTKSEYTITDEQERKLRQTGLSGKIDINGSTIAANNIAEIVKVKEENHYKALPEYTANYTKASHIRALESLIRGFKKHFGNREMPVNSKQILARMENKLEVARTAPDGKFNNPLKEIRLFGETL